MARVRAINRRAFLAGTLASAAAAGLSACSSSSTGQPNAASSSQHAGGSPKPSPAGAGNPPVNPYLAASEVPVGHNNSAQTNSVDIAGPTGPTQTLTSSQLQYQFTGPGPSGVSISPPYPDGSRVIWVNNGSDRISKLDYETFEVLATLALPGKKLVSRAESESIIASLDSASGDALAQEAVKAAAKYLVGLSGIYFCLDRDNTLFIADAESIVAYADTEPGKQRSPIAVRSEWKRPNGIGGGFIGINMTFDGKLVVVTDEGQIVVLERDFSSYVNIGIPGSEAAAAHNRKVLAQGARAGSASWVRNSIAVDAQGGIYVASLDQMHRLVWNGKTVSSKESDGAWSAPYLNGDGKGTGATPALMGFGSDEFVVITDGEPVMNVVLFWRGEIPSDWKQLPGAPSRRIAGMVRSDMGDPNATSVQSEQGVVVGGYGAFVVNNAPHSIPAGFPTAATGLLSSYAGADPAFTPKAMQKFAWDPKARKFGLAWTNTQVSSPNSVPLVSTASNVVYTVGARDGKWTLEALDWSDGSSKFHWTTGSGRYNSNFSAINIDQQGRIMHATEFGLVRYKVSR